MNEVINLDQPKPEPVVALPTARKISNSEVTTWLTCTQMYEFAFMDNLASKVTPMPLARGTLGHLAFQYYIEARLNESDHDQAMTASNKAFTEALQTKMDVSTVVQTQSLFVRYMGVKQGWPKWKLLGTEQAYEIPVTEDIIIPMRYDILIEERESGRILIGDFKFTYDFWSLDDHALNGQMSKYITILKAQGMQIDGGFLEEIRTRELSKAKVLDHRNLWKTTHYYPTPTKRRNMLKQHIAASLQIDKFRKMTPEEQEYEIIPVLNKHGACKYCNFKELCNSKLEGKDISFDKEHGFVQNTYGYNGEADALPPTNLKELL